MSTKINDDTDSSWAGMTYTQLEAKHRRLRGTDDLRYPPSRRERCQSMCGLGDLVEGHGDDKQYSSHQCMLSPLPHNSCQFSSECELTT